MKNISFLSNLVIILFLFSAINNANCQEMQNNKNYDFSLGTQFGFVYGKSYEYVYESDSRNELFSKLNYDLKPVYYLGISADISRSNIMSGLGFFISLDFKIGIHGDSGIHENRDWLDHNNRDKLTDYSFHINRTKGFYWIDFAVGMSIPVRSLFYLKPFLNGSWMHFSFTGRDGQGIYVNPSYNITVIYKGEIIRYRQDWYLIAAGLSIGTVKFFPISMDFTFQISPLTFCMARDDHLYSQHRVFMDFSGFGLFIEPSGRVSLSIKNFDISLETAYRYIGRTLGPAYKDSWNTGNFSSAGSAGAGLSLLDTRFLFKIKL